MPSHVVLDTDVASRSIKGSLDGPLAGKLVGASWWVTFVTEGELWQWAAERRWGGRRRERLQRWLGRVAPIDSNDHVARTWGEISAAARLRGRPRPVNDSWIAACCIAYDLPLATLNVKHFTDFEEHEGLRLLA